jgi:hypothetical protein
LQRFLVNYYGLFNDLHSPLYRSAQASVMPRTLKRAAIEALQFHLFAAHCIDGQPPEIRGRSVSMFRPDVRLRPFKGTLELLGMPLADGSSWSGDGDWLPTTSDQVNALIDGYMGHSTRRS